MQSIRKWPEAVRENLPLLASTIVWTLAWIVVSRALALPKVTNQGILSYVLAMSTFFVQYLLPLLLLLIPLSHLLRGGRARELARLAFWKATLGGYLSRRVLGGFVVALICMPVFYATYRDWKTAVPAIVPFYFDPWFEAAERWLHGGRHPWEWLHGFLGQPMRTQVIDNLYIFWFQVQFGVVLWMSLTRRRWLRARFFITYILMYILLGHLMATAFSSVGPPYYGRVVAGTDPFEPLMRYLHGLNDDAILYAVDIQARLWDGYVGTYDGPISGIAAFPSLHVGAATVFLLVGLSVHPVAAVLFFAFLVVTLAGSVHLGWHYALDGYVSIVAVVGFWALSGPLTRRFFRWAGLDALDDPSAPADFRRVDARPSGTEADEGVEGDHGRLVTSGREGRGQPSMP
jgi:hypothetical protein